MTISVTSAAQACGIADEDQDFFQHHANIGHR